LREVLKRMIETASLRIDSPKMRINKFLSTPISLKIPKTATGSVALIRELNAKDSFRVQS
jgi:uncharacterized membrane protein